MSDDPFAVVWVNDPPPVQVVEDPQVILAAMRRELAGIEHRLEHLHDPGERRPFDRLLYQQRLAELEEYRDTVKAQIKAQQARVRAAAS